MSAHTQCLVYFAAAVLAASTINPAQATGQWGHKLGVPTATLSATAPMADLPIVEHSPISIPFVLTVGPGIAGALPTRDLVVCPDTGGKCAVFLQVTPPWTNGAVNTITMDAPIAGSAVPIRLVACTAATSADGVVSCGKKLAETTISVDIAMRFLVQLDSVTIFHTRARQRDTTFYGFAAIEDGMRAPSRSICSSNLAELTDPRFCIGPRPLGEIADGIHPVPNASMGAFEWVPGKNKNITLAFTTVNRGAPTPPLTGPTFDRTAESMQALLNKLGANDVGVLADFTPEINDLSGWLGCDGPTSAGAKRLYNFRSADRTEPTVEELTRNTGAFSASSKIYVVPSQSGCGDSSKYQVAWSIHRTSWRSY